MAEEYKNIKTFYAKTKKAWRKWLHKNEAIEKSVWLIMYRKTSKTPSVYYDEAVEEALCFGWIDSKANKRDEESYYQFFSPRKPKSNWSKLNKTRVEKLITQGLMTKSGMVMINLAKQKGTWTALDNLEQLIIPPDMQKLFVKNKVAYKNFQAFPPSTIRGILEWILNAKKPETRQHRINQTISLAAENIKANQYRQ